MTLAISWGESDTEEGGLLYMDAVSVYTQNYSGQVTKHPVDSGSSITDHYISDNPIFTVSCVFSPVDISTASSNIQDLDGNFAFNTQLAPNPVSVNSTDLSVLSNFIPDSIGQFLPDNTPDVQMDGIRTDLTDQIRDTLNNLRSGKKFNLETGQFDSNIQIVRLFEFQETLLRRIVNNLVITNIVYNEDASTGLALYCNITFEQVTFAFLKKTELPQDVAEPLKKKASSKKSLGKCDSTIKDANDPNNTDPQSTKDAVNNSANDADPLRTVTQ
jgi:hypothetical protein